MSTSSNVFPERRSLSNVSFSPLSSDVLYVRIRKMSGEGDVPQISTSVRSPSKKPVPDQSKSIGHSKLTMTDSQTKASVSSQTSQKEEKKLVEAHSSHDSTPCLRHAAANISRKASNIPSEKVNLCNNCSKSMLSYIFLVQDFLDSLAKEILGSEISHCLQCARQEMRNTIATSVAKDGDITHVESASQKHSDHQPHVKTSLQKHSDRKSKESRQKDVSYESEFSDRVHKRKSHKQELQRNEDSQRVISTASQNNANKSKKQHTDYSAPSSYNSDYIKAQNASHENFEQQVTQQSHPENKITQNSQPIHDNIDQNANLLDINNQDVSASYKDISNMNQHNSQDAGNDVQHQHSYKQPHGQPGDTPVFRTPKERVQPNYDALSPTIPEKSSRNDPNDTLERSPNLYGEDLDGIISTLSTAEREVYDSARNRAGWESFTESQERLVVPSGNLITTEAFVTSCRNNAEAVGCLVLGASLLLCRTSRTLCVLVSEGVSTAFRNAFSAIFQVVQLVRSLDSLGTTKLALLEQPELGVTFEKLNVWRLVQFTKCIYLNPDTLVIQNCDELFYREELSAVPDIGWPDCFNSGVFVYSPSIRTFWQLLEFAEKQGSYDGGDQGLLNSYFNSWSSDLSKKLSFIYNLMANVSYTYTPAFRQFGRDVKIVQFHGSFKPWHVKFFTKTGQISPSSPVHPTYVQFVHIWINIFRITVLRLLSKEIQSYAAAQETISAVEMLRFFPLPSESESDFFLTPPSVRLRLAEQKLNRSTSSAVSEARRRRKSAEVVRNVSIEEDAQQTDVSPEEETKEKDIKKIDVPDEEPKTKSENLELKLEVAASDEEAVKDKVEASVSEADEVFKESEVVEKEKKAKDENTLPGSEMGDYHGMKAWEQGRMDYEGSDSSDNIIKRLQFLMNPKPK